MSVSRWGILLGVAILPFIGCSSVPSSYTEDWSSVEAKRVFVTERKELARGYESNESLQTALQEWFVISAVIPENSEPRTEIDRLEKEILKRVKRHREAAKSALAKKNYQRAKLHYLKILALQPDNQDVIRELKQLEAKLSYARLTRTPKITNKLVQGYAAPSAQVTSKVAGDNPNRPPGEVSDGQAHKASTVESYRRKDNLRLALGSLSKQEYQVALEYFIRARKLGEAPASLLEKYITDTRYILAERHYDQGVAVFRAARYEQAIKEFQKALKYNPDHRKARLYLGNADEMRMRLAPSGTVH